MNLWIVDYLPLNSKTQPNKEAYSRTVMNQVQFYKDSKKANYWRFNTSRVKFLPRMYHAPVVEAKTSAESSEAIIAKKVLWMTVLLFLFFRLYFFKEILGSHQNWEKGAEKILI